MRAFYSVHVFSMQKVLHFGKRMNPSMELCENFPVFKVSKTQHLLPHVITIC